MDKNNSRTLNENSRINEEKQRIRSIYCKIEVKQAFTNGMSPDSRLETRRKWRFSGDPWLPPSLLCSASLLLLLLLHSGEKQKEWKKKQLLASRGLEDCEGGNGSVSW